MNILQCEELAVVGEGFTWNLHPGTHLQQRADSRHHYYVFRPGRHSSHSRSGDRPRGGPRHATTAVLRHATGGDETRAGRQAQPEPSRPLPLTAIIGRTGHFIDAVIFRRAGGDETYGGEGGCDVKDVMDFQPNEYLTKVTQEWKWRDGVRWEGTCVRFPATV